MKSSTYNRLCNDADCYGSGPAHKGYLLIVVLVVYTAVVFLFLLSSSYTAEKADLVLVQKSKRMLYLLNNGNPIASFPIVLGGNPNGHKQQEGDQRTPEGHYTLDFKKENSSFYRAIHISYPNTVDSMTAKANGVDPGGNIMIHGQRNGLGWAYFLSRYFDWTQGCIAVSNADMDKIWTSVDEGTPIDIQP